MSTSKKVTFVLICILFTITFFSYSAFCNYDFLTLNSDPEVVAMGDCAINNINAKSALYNPGAIGLFYLNKNLSFSIPNTTHYKNTFTDELTNKFFSIGAGINLKQIKQIENEKLNAGIGIAYSYKKTTYGEMIEYDMWNFMDSIGTYFPYGTANMLSVGFGLDYYVRLGLGFTVKKVYSDLIWFENFGYYNNDKRTLFDFGFMLDVPLNKIFPIELLFGDNKHRITYKFTPSIAYVISDKNLNVKYDYIDFPTVSQIGISITAGINIDKSSLVSLRPVYEIEKNYFMKSVNYYRYGLEVGILEVFYYRNGKYTYNDGHSEC